MDNINLNKETRKDYFPLLFIDQMLDILIGGKVWLLFRWVLRVKSYCNFS